MRWFNYSDEELIDFAMDSQETLAYELACRLESLTKDYDKAMGRTSQDNEISDLKDEVDSLRYEVAELEAKLSDNAGLITLVSRATELTKQANQILGQN